MEVKIENNIDKSCFESFVDDQRFYLNYEIDDSKIYINTVQIPKSLEGKGYGKKISDFVIEYAIANKLEIVSRCGFFAVCYDRYKKQHQ